METNKYPLRIDCRIVIYVSKDKCTPEYADKKRKQFNSEPVAESRGGNSRIHVDVEEIRTCLQQGMYLREIAKKMGGGVRLLLIITYRNMI